MKNSGRPSDTQRVDDENDPGPLKPKFVGIAFEKVRLDPDMVGRLYSEMEEALDGIDIRNSPETRDRLTRIAGEFLTRLTPAPRVEVVASEADKARGVMCVKVTAPVPAMYIGFPFFDPDDEDLDPVAPHLGLGCSHEALAHLGDDDCPQYILDPEGHDDSKDHTLCQDCNGSGWYQGFRVKEHCATCDGSGWL